MRAHVLPCMLAYYVELHMRQARAPILFDDQDRAVAAAERRSVAVPAQRSPAARCKRTTLCLNNVSQPSDPNYRFSLATEPNALQARAFDLLGVRLPR